MSCYEANFERLMWLIPGIQNMEGLALSEGRDLMDLQLEVVERCRYTLTIALTHYFRSDGVLVSDPYMKIRIYLDARVAEVLSYQNHRFQFLHPSPILNELNLCEKRQINKFLGEWLDYCISQGHGFLSEVRCTKA
ncbi:MAG: DUF1249 domain-containing protein [Gammaproteobacteria bacterium]|nr:DUF1249 domain-containing protein [Gammaproteobacteria bacterium]